MELEYRREASYGLIAATHFLVFCCFCSHHFSHSSSLESEWPPVKTNRLWGEDKDCVCVCVCVRRRLGWKETTHWVSQRGGRAREFVLKENKKKKLNSDQEWRRKPVYSFEKKKSGYWSHGCCCCINTHLRGSLLEGGVPRLCGADIFPLHRCWQTQEEAMMMALAGSKRQSKRDDREAKRTLFQLEGRVNARNWLSEPMQREEEELQQTDRWAPTTTSSCSKLLKLTPWRNLSIYLKTLPTS